MQKLEKLVELVEIKRAGKSPVEFFFKLRDEDFSRLELMILDSAIKKMPMKNLYNTLLLPESNYLEIIDKIIDKLTLCKV
jgi:hypothetical protein